MAKKTYDITHRVTRILASDYAFLAQLSLEFGKPMAEVLHAIITEREMAMELPPTTYHLPTPALALTPTPVTTYHLPPTTSRISSKIAVNGSKSAAFGTKVRRVKYE